MNITAVKGILNRKFGGASIDDIQGIDDYSLFKEAADNLLMEMNSAESVRHNTVEVFLDVYDYNIPVDVKDLIDERPQSASRARNDNPTRRFSQDFDQNKAEKNGDFTLEYVDGTRIARFSKSIQGGGNKTLHDMDSLSSNGLWTGTASNISLSTRSPYRGSGSIQADYDTGEAIQNSTLDAVDLSDHENQSTLFLGVYLPSRTVVTSLTLEWGSSTGNYFTQTATTPQTGAFQNGWNLVAFPWNGAVETGTVDTSAIDFLKFIPTLNESETGIKVDSIFSALGEIRELVYYSQYLFKIAETGEWTDIPTADEDIVNLDTNAANLFVYECIRLAALQIQGANGIHKEYTDILYGDGQEVGKYTRYKKTNPDEPIQPQVQYRRFGYKKK